MRCVHRAAHGLMPSKPRLRLDFARGEYWLRGRRYSDVSDILTHTRNSAAFGKTASGALVAFAANQPRITSGVGLKVEGQKTNLARWSQDFSNSVWIKTNAGTTVDIVYPAIGLAPDGTATVNKIVERADTGAGHDIGQTIVAAPGTFSHAVRFKAAERTMGHLRTTNFVDGGYSAVFDLVAGTATLDASQRGTCTNGAATIEPLADGWFECVLTQTTTVGTGFAVAFGPTILPTQGNGSYTGEAGKGIYAWGAQPESGAATSYIVTTTAAGTRAQDTPIINNIFDLLGATRINLCTNKNVDPYTTTNVTFTNASNGLATFGGINDFSALAASPDHLDRYTSDVFVLDNTLGLNTAFVIVSGAVAATNIPAIASAHVRGGSGSIAPTPGGGTPFPASADYARRFDARQPDSTVRSFGIYVNAGQKVYFTLNMLEPWPVANPNSPSSITGTSATSVALTSGTKNFVTQAGLGWTSGQFVVISSQSNSAAYFMGTVSTYVGTTLTVVVPNGGVFGSGTPTDWIIRTPTPSDPIVTQGATAAVVDPFSIFVEATFPTAINGSVPRLATGDLYGNGIINDGNTYAALTNVSTFQMYNGFAAGPSSGIPFRGRKIKAMARFRSTGRAGTIDGVPPIGDSQVHGPGTRLCIGVGGAVATVSDATFSVVEVVSDVADAQMQAR